VAVSAGCFLVKGDDNIALKAMDTRTQKSPPHVSIDSSNGDWTGQVGDVLVEQCALWNDHGGSAMEIGYETRTATISNITFRDIDVMAGSRMTPSTTSASAGATSSTPTRWACL